MRISMLHAHDHVDLDTHTHTHTHTKTRDKFLKIHMTCISDTTRLHDGSMHAAQENIIWNRLLKWRAPNCRFQLY